MDVVGESRVHRSIHTSIHPYIHTEPSAPKQAYRRLSQKEMEQEGDQGEDWSRGCWERCAGTIRQMPQERGRVYGGSERLPSSLYDSDGECTVLWVAMLRL